MVNRDKLLKSIDDLLIDDLIEKMIIKSLNESIREEMEENLIKSVLNPAKDLHHAAIGKPILPINFQGIMNKFMGKMSRFARGFTDSAPGIVNKIRGGYGAMNMDSLLRRIKSTTKNINLMNHGNNMFGVEEYMTTLTNPWSGKNTPGYGDMAMAA